MKCAIVDPLRCEHCSEDLSYGPYVALPYASAMRTVGWIEGPFDVILHEAIFYPRLVPLVDGSAKFTIAAYEVPTIIRSDGTWFATPSNESHQFIKECVRVHA